MKLPRGRLAARACAPWPCRRGRRRPRSVTSYCPGRIGVSAPLEGPRAPGREACRAPRCRRRRCRRRAGRGRRSTAGGSGRRAPPGRRAKVRPLSVTATLGIVAVARRCAPRCAGVDCLATCWVSGNDRVDDVDVERALGLVLVLALAAAAARERERAQRRAASPDEDPSPSAGGNVPVRQILRAASLQRGGSPTLSPFGGSRTFRAVRTYASRDPGQQRERHLAWFEASPIAGSCRSKNLLEEVGDMMILTGKTIMSALRPPYPVRRRVRQPVPLRAEALLVPAARLDGRVRLRRAGPAGRELPRAVRRARPPRRLLRARVDPRVRAVRDRDRRSPASPAPRSPPTSAPARSARSSTRCRCSASTRSRTSSSRASSR